MRAWPVAVLDLGSIPLPTALASAREDWHSGGSGVFLRKLGSLPYASLKGVGRGTKVTARKAMVNAQRGCSTRRERHVGG